MFVFHTHKDNALSLETVGFYGIDPEASLEEFFRLNIDFFFAKPFASWQRGSNENYNRLVRQYIPKKVDFDYVTHDYVQYVEQQLNNRPRKRFGYLSPNQIVSRVWNTLEKSG